MLLLFPLTHSNIYCSKFGATPTPVPTAAKHSKVFNSSTMEL